MPFSGHEFPYLTRRSAVRRRLGIAVDIAHQRPKIRLPASNQLPDNKSGKTDWLPRFRHFGRTEFHQQEKIYLLKVDLAGSPSPAKNAQLSTLHRNGYKHHCLRVTSVLEPDLHPISSTSIVDTKFLDTTPVKRDSGSGSRLGEEPAFVPFNQHIRSWLCRFGLGGMFRI